MKIATGRCGPIRDSRKRVIRHHDGKQLTCLRQDFAPSCLTLNQPNDVAAIPMRLEE